MLGESNLIGRWQGLAGRMGACLGWIFLTVGALVAAAEEPGPLLEIVRREAPLGWERLIARRQMLHYAVSVTDAQGNRSMDVTKVRGAFRVHTIEEQAGDVRVLGVNDLYAFELTAPHRDRPYRLVQISWLKKDQPLNPLDWMALHALSKEAIYKPIMIACLPLPELVRHPSFRWLSAEETWRDGT